MSSNLFKVYVRKIEQLEYYDHRHAIHFHLLEVQMRIGVRSRGGIHLQQHNNNNNKDRTGHHQWRQHITVVARNHMEVEYSHRCPI